MTNDSDVTKLLTEAAEKLRQEGYAAGWRDAMAAINKAISEIAPPEIPTEGAIFDIQPSTTSQISHDGPNVGSTPWYVLQAVRKRPGMTGIEAINYVREGGHKVPGGSIRVALNRLKARKLVVSRHGKWFPA